MSLHGELTGAAARRRGRRLRSWLRHERQTVAMVLAEACHHSSGTFPPTLKERRMAGQDAYEALRGQKTARTAGLHPDELVEPGVQGRAVTVGYVAARVPTLAGHRLASDDDGVDGRTVRFLLKQSLAEKKKEWEEERRRMVQESVEQVRARVDAENAARHASTGKRRKRKKRRKKKLPRAPRPRQGRQRPCDHQQQVPAVLVVRESGGAPASVHRQSGGYSCFVCRDVYPLCKLCRRLARFYRRCSWTRLRRPLLYNNRCLGYDSAENCGQSAVAACRLFGPGRRHLCRGAETNSYGLVHETIEILQLQYTDKVIVVPVVPVQVPSAGVEKTAELPRSSWKRWLTCPWVQRQVPMTHFNKVVDVPVILRVEVPQVQFIADVVDIPARNRDRPFPQK